MLDRSQRTLVAAECRDVIIAFAHHLDHRRFEKAAKLFAAQGIWHRHGEKLVGPEQILATIRTRSADLVERHICSTIDVEVLATDHARAVSYVTIVRHTSSGQTDTYPSQVIGEFHDELRLIAGEWQLTERRSIGVFSYEGQ